MRVLLDLNILFLNIYLDKLNKLILARRNNRIHCSTIKRVEM